MPDFEQYAQQQNIQPTPPTDFPQTPTVGLETQVSGGRLFQKTTVRNRYTGKILGYEWTDVGPAPREALGGGGGGGGGGGAGRVLARAPDPLGAAQTLIDFYAAQIRSGQLTLDQATAQVQRDLGEGRLALERAGEERRRFMEPQQEATARAGIIARDILPSALPAGFTPNLPLLGQVPLNPLNLGSLFSQGLPPLSAMPALGSMPSIGQIPQITQPALPDLSGLISAGAGGFPGF